MENFAGSEASLMSCRRLLQYLGNLVGDVDDNLVIWEALLGREKVFKKMLGCDVCLIITTVYYNIIYHI